jgi:hypothetical protein
MKKKFMRDKILFQLQDLVEISILMKKNFVKMEYHLKFGFNILNHLNL